jgi:hypothetical protein
LNDQKVRVAAGSSFRPECAALEVVQKFEDDKDGGPNVDKIIMAWYQPLSSTSPWNWDAITILAEKARQSLRASETKYDASWLTIQELMKQIVVSLKDTKKMMDPSSSLSSKAVAVQQRRRSRRVMVSSLSHEHNT